jgi:hypothetical protein
MRNPRSKDRSTMPYVAELIKHIRGRIYENTYLAMHNRRIGHASGA